MAEQAALDFAGVLDLYTRAKERIPPVRDMTLPQFSEFMNRHTRSQAFSQGLQDSKIKRASVWLDELLEPVAKPVGSAFAGLTELVAPQFTEVAREVGEATPRGLIDYGSIGVGLALGGAPAALPMAARALAGPLIAGGVGSAFSKGYADTGSKLVGAINAAVGLAAPSVGGLGTKGAARALTSRFPTISGGKSAVPFLEKLVEFGGATTSLTALNEAARQATGVALGQGLSVPTKEDVFANLAGIVPFLPFEAVRMVRGAEPGMFASMGEKVRAEQLATREAQIQKRVREYVETKIGGGSQYEFPFVGKVATKAAVAPEAVPPTASAVPTQADVQLGFESLRTDVTVEKQKKQAGTWMGELITTVEKPTEKHGIRLMQRAAAALGVDLQTYVNRFPEAAAVYAPETMQLGEKLGSKSVELTAAVTKAVEEGTVFKGDEGVKEVGKIANEAASLTGDPPPVTDAIVSQKLEQHLETKSEVDATQTVKQIVENEAVAAVTKLSKAEQNTQKAFAELATLNTENPEAADFIQRVLVDVQSKVEAERLGPQIEGQLAKSAMSWWRKNSARATPLLKDPLTRATIGKELASRLGNSIRRARGSALSKKAEQTVEIPEGMSPEGREVLTEVEQERRAQRLEVLEAPVTAEELAAVGHPATPEDVAGVNKAFEKLLETGAFPVGSSKWVRAVRDVTTKRMGQLGPMQVDPMDFSKSPVSTLATALFAPIPEQARTVESTVASVTEFAKSHFKKQGYAPQAAEEMSKVFTKVAAHFNHIERVEIARLVSQTWQGVQMSSPTGGRQIVALNFGSIKSRGEGFRNYIKAVVTGHELFHGLQRRVLAAGNKFSPESKALQNLQDWFDTTPSDVRSAIMRELTTMSIPLKDQVNNLQFIDKTVAYADTSAIEYSAQMAGTLLAIASGESNALLGLKEFLGFSDKSVLNFSKLILTDADAVLKVFIDLSLLGKKKEAQAHTFFKEMHTSITGLLKTVKEAEASIMKLEYFAQHLPAMYKDWVLSGTHEKDVIHDPNGPVHLYPAAKDTIVDYSRMIGLLNDKRAEELFGKLPNWFERNIMPPPQLRELYPELNEVTNMLFGFRARVSHFLNKAMTPMLEIDKYGQPRLNEENAIFKVRTDEQMTKAYSAALLEQNDNQKPITDAEVTTIAKDLGLSDEKAQTVVTLVNQHRQSMEAMADLLIKHFVDSMGDMSAVLFQGKNRNIPGGEVIKLGEQFINAVIALDANPNNALASQALQTVQAQVGDAAFGQAVDSITRLMPKFKESAANLQRRKGWYAPETRLGQFMLRWYDTNEKLHFEGYKTREELLKRHEQLLKGPVRVGNTDVTAKPASIKATDKHEYAHQVNTLYPDIFRSAMDLEESAFRDALSHIDSEAAETMSKLYTPLQKVFEEVQAAGFGKHFLARKGVAGREQIDFVEGTLAYIEGMALGVSKKTTKTRSAILLGDKSMQDNPTLRNLARDYVISVVDPPAREWSTVKRLGFHYFLGGNISSLMVEMAQPMFTLAPELVRHGVGVAKSYFAIGKAAKELARIASTEKASDPEILRALKQAQDEHVIDFGIVQELSNIHHESAVLNLRNLARGQKPLSVANMLSKPLYWYIKTAEWAYRGATSTNSRIAFLSGFLEKFNGSNFDDAYAFGKRVTQNSMHGGGAAARPLLLGKFGKAYGAAGALYTLRHFSVATISMLYRFMKDAINKELPKEQRASAQKAFGQMAITQTLAAGALGLPLSSAIISTLEAIFPNLEIKKTMRETLADIAGDDDEMGSLVSDVAMHGVLNLTGIDFASRFGLGDAFGADPNAGFTASTLLGVPGGLIERWARGAGLASTGDLTEATRQFAPNWMANLIKLYNDDGKVRNAKGELLYEPTEAEQFASAVGLKPRRLSQFREQTRLMDRAEDVASRKQRKFHDELADLLLEGKTQEVRAQLIRRRETDDLYDPAAGLSSVVEIAQKKTVPTDPQRHGVRASLRDRERLAATYPPIQAIPTEAEQYVRRKLLERSVGIPGAGQLAPGELMHARAVDQLMALHPNLSAQRAAIIVQSMLSRRAQPLSATGGVP